MAPRTLCRLCACRSALAVAPCAFSTLPANHLLVSCVSNGCRCGAVRIFHVAGELSAGSARVEWLSLWRRAYFPRCRRSPLQGSRVSNGSRCGAVRIFNVAGEPCAGFLRVDSLSLNFKVASEPSAGFVRVETLSLWRRANFQRRRFLIFRLF